MNFYQKNLYNDLMVLCRTNEAFYYVDQELDGFNYRIFSYRLASYTDFLAPNALECRGHMFEMNGNRPVRLSSLPFQKFFNAYENPFVMDLDYTEPKQIMLKMDGSLISSYLLGSEVALKSKTSLISDQAREANEILKSDVELYDETLMMAISAYTVNFEYTAPTNRIVVGYTKPALTVLGIRDNHTGKLLRRDDIKNNYPKLASLWVETIEVEDGTTFLQNIKDLQGIEGYVVELKDGTYVKMKTMWYVSLHRAKDSAACSQRRIFEVILDEGIDDVRSMFHDDVVLIQQIDEMQTKADHWYNEMVSSTEKFYAENKHLERKEYAVKGQAELDKKWFCLAMNLYLGKTNDYKAYLKGLWKVLGLKDEHTKQLSSIEE